VVDKGFRQRVPLAGRNRFSAVGHRDGGVIGAVGTRRPQEAFRDGGVWVGVSGGGSAVCFANVGRLRLGLTALTV